MTQENEKVALLDLDGSLADYDGAMHAAMQKLLSPGEVLPSNLYTEGHHPWLENRMNLIKAQPGFWRDLPAIPLGFTVLHWLVDHEYSCNVLTKGPKHTHSAWTEKMQWSARHLPGVPVTITQDKGLVYGKVLYDDYPPYIKRWLLWRPRGKVIMRDTVHNQGFEHPQVLRVFDGADVVVTRHKLDGFLLGAEK